MVLNLHIAGTKAVIILPFYLYSNKYITFIRMKQKLNLYYYYYYFNVYNKKEALVNIFIIKLVQNLWVH